MKRKGGQNFGEEEKGSDREGSEIEQSEGTKKLKPKEQNRGGKLSEKKRRTETGGSLHKGEEGPFLTTWAPPLCFLSSATTAPSSPSLKQPCTVRNRRRNTEKKQKQRKKKQRQQHSHPTTIHHRRSNHHRPLLHQLHSSKPFGHQELSLPPLFLTCRFSSPSFFLPQPPSTTTAATAYSTLPFTPARPPPSQVSLSPLFLLLLLRCTISTVLREQWRVN